MTFCLIFLGVALAIALGCAAKLNPAFMPTPMDEILLMEDAITKTTSFVGATFDLSMGAGKFAAGGVGQAIGACLMITTLSFASGDESYVFTVFESADGLTWTAAGPPVTATAVGPLTVPAFISQPYIRLSVVMGGTLPMAAYSAWANPNILPG